MTDYLLEMTAEAQFDFISGGVAFTTPTLPFRPDYAQLINLTQNTDDALLKAEWYRDMTATHFFGTYRMVNDGGNNGFSFGRVTSGGFTLVENAAGVDTTSSAAASIISVALTDPCVIGDTAHGLSNGDTIRITDVVGTVELNNRRFRVNNVTTNAFDIQDPETRTNIDGTNFTAWTSGGRWNKLNVVDANRVVFDPLTYTMLMAGTIMGADSDVLKLIVRKMGAITDLGDIG